MNQGKYRAATFAMALLTGIVPTAIAQTTAPASPPATATTPAEQGKQTVSPATVPPAMSSGASQKAAGLTAGDKKFMQIAARDGNAEVQMAKLAVQKATDPQVKQFAERMVADHTKAGDKLKQIAAGKNVQLPGDVTSAEKRAYDKLAKLSGAQFDREYMKHMVDDHRKATTEFRNASKTVRDADLKQFAQETLPTLEGHFAMAKETSSKVTAAAKKS